MRHLLLALPFALLPLAVAQAAHDHDHDHHDAHGSLDKHEHGVAALNVALDGQTLELGLESPAMNIVGFEHAANSDAARAKVAAARAQLEQPLALFALPPEAGCTVAGQELESPLFGNDGHDHDHDEHEHSDIDAEYRLTCAQPEQLKTLDLSAFFKQFPGTLKLNVQLIGPNGQKGAELTPANPRLGF
ncbi:DUF2796 domain-containing protein [Zestomonas carbonaria]|uniref:Zinc-binding protein n=1 Tax=Zestomonas carbonaria TaxID=2762745 RepID=A0A7U7EPR4_9GAMM|nr:DUF2796 domain-containing protein [Pseudomonas carbonaria]CAD5108908.1 hypothetical protein PSEWESI4_03204 [Pseudomonas carbonaria]